ncbi:MAG: Amidohydrolase [Pseudoclavibacter caeni]|jgi:predicted amidohydrolase YtcJ
MFRLDTILENATFLTMDDEHPVAHRVGVLGGRIAGVDDDLDGLDVVERLDLRGGLALPGFNDVHCHTTWYGLTLAEVDLGDLHTLPDLYARVGDAVAAARPGEWIRCTGFNHHLYGGERPDIRELDRISPDNPVFIRQTSGHSSIVNTVTLRMIGALQPGFRDPEGGRVVRDAHGAPTGLVEEQAQTIVQQLTLPYSTAAIVAALDRATTEYARQGLTSFTDAGIAGGWIGYSPVELLAYQQALDAGRLHARAQVMPFIGTLHDIPAHADDDFGIGLDLGMRSGLGDDRLSIGPTKIFTDGALSGETAALTEHYHTHDDFSGYLQDEADLLHDRIVQAARSGWAVAAHAIGDRAIDVAIDAIAEGMRLAGRPPIPHRIEHAAVLRDDQLARIRELGIVPTPQPAFFANIGDGMIRSLGAERAAITYRGRSLLDAGIVLPGSSDRPCAPGEPLVGIQEFVTRETASGAVFGTSAECLTVDQALRAYTVGSAQATGMADRRGRLRRGMLADVVVLGADPRAVEPHEIADIPVRATLVGGRLTHEAL